MDQHDKESRQSNLLEEVLEWGLESLEFGIDVILDVLNGLF
ncbi:MULTISPECIES: hypothetical protein [Deefgea]|nr:MULTISPECIES: hypothetical protein [Deefgea]